MGLHDSHAPGTFAGIGSEPPTAAAVVLRRPARLDPGAPRQVLNQLDPGAHLALLNGDVDP